MLIKRQPKLRWFINLLSIILLCILIANSLICSLYIISLKQRITEIAESYFFAQVKIQGSLNALIETRVETQNLKFYLLQDSKDYEKISQISLKNFKKNELIFYYLILSLKRNLANKYMGEQVSSIYVKSDKYMSHIEEIMENKNKLSPDLLIKSIVESNEEYLSIKREFEVFSQALQSKVIEVKNADDALYKALPFVLCISFVLALLIGGRLIYLSRQEVKSSIIENVSQALSEAYQNQKDCIHTLHLVGESLKNEKTNPFWQYFDTRHDLHAQELLGLEKLLNEIKKLN